MSVFKQLQKARTMFLSAPIKKSGKNKFAGYEYFELSDFIPTVHKIFDEVGLCGVVRFTNEVASLTVYGDEGSIEFTSPMVFAENAKQHAVSLVDRKLGIDPRVKGYTWNNQRNKWWARIRMPDKRQRHLGFFNTEEEAHNAYLVAKREERRAVLALHNVL